MTKQPDGASGFSLLELVVAVALTAVVALALAAAFAGGLAVWERARRLQGVPTEAVLFGRTFPRDVRNTFHLAGLKLKGTAEELTLPGWVPTRDRQGVSRVRVGLIRYGYDPTLGIVWRAAWDLPAGTAEDATREPIVSGVEALRFAYYDKPADRRGQGAWRGTWLERTNFPAAIKVSLNLREGDEHVASERTVVLPCP